MIKTEIGGGAMNQGAQMIAETEDPWLAQYAAAQGAYCGAIETAGYSAAQVEGLPEKEFTE